MSLERNADESFRTYECADSLSRSTASDARNSRRVETLSAAQRVSGGTGTSAADQSHISARARKSAAATGGSGWRRRTESSASSAAAGPSVGSAGATPSTTGTRSVLRMAASCIAAAAADSARLRSPRAQEWLRTASVVAGVVVVGRSTAASGCSSSSCLNRDVRRPPVPVPEGVVEAAGGTGRFREQTAMPKSRVFFCHTTSLLRRNRSRAQIRHRRTFSL